ncbi:hypothetical protein C7212DRAFT_171233, partial [Tuber magnatum]
RVINRDCVDKRNRNDHVFVWKDPTFALQRWHSIRMTQTGIRRRCAVKSGLNRAVVFPRWANEEARDPPGAGTESGTSKPREAAVTFSPLPNFVAGKGPAALSGHKVTR